MKLDHEQVMGIIPHRDPMLLIDEVSDLVPGEYIDASFWVDPAREIFKGHFPGPAGNHAGQDGPPGLSVRDSMTLSTLVQAGLNKRTTI